MCERLKKSAGQKDWRAWQAWLQLGFASDYRGNANKIEVSATANASSGVDTHGGTDRSVTRAALNRDNAFYGFAVVRIDVYFALREAAEPPARVVNRLLLGLGLANVGSTPGLSKEFQQPLNLPVTT